MVAMTARTTSRRTRAALAGTTVVTLALLLGACGGDDTGTPGPEAAPETSSGPAAVELTLPESAAAKCAMPSAEVLSQMDTAFEATVTSVDGDRVTLDVERWFTGGEAGTVVVTQPSTAISEPVVVFEPDRTYLVSATDDVVSMCGFSAETGPELAAMYDEAFPAAD